jgi:hypothetical protein
MHVCDQLICGKSHRITKKADMCRVQEAIIGRFMLNLALDCLADDYANVRSTKLAFNSTTFSVVTFNIMSNDAPDGCIRQQFCVEF